MRLLLLIIVLVACCIIFEVELGIALIIVGVCFLSVAGFDAKLGCLGRIIDIILLIIGTALIIAGFCSM